MSLLDTDWSAVGDLVCHVRGKLSCKDAASMRRVCTLWKACISVGHLDTTYRKVVCRWQKILQLPRRCAVLRLVRPVWHERYGELYWAVDILCDLPARVLDSHYSAVPKASLARARDVLSMSQGFLNAREDSSFRLAMILVANFVTQMPPTGTAPYAPA